MENLRGLEELTWILIQLLDALDPQTVENRDSYQAAFVTTCERARGCQTHQRDAPSTERDDAQTWLVYTAANDGVVPLPGGDWPWSMKKLITSILLLMYWVNWTFISKHWSFIMIRAGKANGLSTTSADISITKPTLAGITCKERLRVSEALRNEVMWPGASI